MRCIARGLTGDSDAAGCSAETRRAIRCGWRSGQAAERLGPCFSISHLIGGPGQVLRVERGPTRARSGDPAPAEARRRFQAPVARAGRRGRGGQSPLAGRPDAELQGAAAPSRSRRPGGVLVGLFWTDPAEIDRSFPRAAMRLISATGAPGGWAIRRLVPFAERAMSAAGSPAPSCSAGPRELVVDRTVLVFSPPLHDRLGPRLGPVRLFADLSALWAHALKSAGEGARQPTAHPSIPPRGTDVRSKRFLSIKL